MLPGGSRGAKNDSTSSSSVENKLACPPPSSWIFAAGLLLLGRSTILVFCAPACLPQGRGCPACSLFTLRSSLPLPLRTAPGRYRPLRSCGYLREDMHLSNCEVPAKEGNRVWKVPDWVGESERSNIRSAGFTRNSCNNVAENAEGKTHSKNPTTLHSGGEHSGAHRTPCTVAYRTPRAVELPHLSTLPRAWHVCPISRSQHACPTTSGAHEGIYHFMPGTRTKGTCLEHKPPARLTSPRASSMSSMEAA